MSIEARWDRALPGILLKIRGSGPDVDIQLSQEDSYKLMRDVERIAKDRPQPAPVALSAVAVPLPKRSEPSQKDIKGLLFDGPLQDNPNQITVREDGGESTELDKGA